MPQLDDSYMMMVMMMMKSLLQYAWHKNLQPVHVYLFVLDGEKCLSI